MHLMFAPLKRYAQFSGRARRKEYWLFQIVLFVVYGGLYGSRCAQGSGAVLLVSSILSLALLVPALAVGVRRMHDIGRSGWWLFIAMIPVIGGIWQIILLATPGEYGPNQYGPDPKELDDPHVPMARIV